MGNTIIQTMPKTFEGLLLYESFEAPSFMVDQGWTLLNGVPSISANAAKQGLKSFIMDLTYPYISHSISGVAWVALWFYDDASITTGGFTPEVQWVDNHAATYGLGVDLSVSTTFYTKTTAGVKAASTVPRTTGWHRYTIGVTGSNFITAIDGTACSTFSVALTTLVTMKLGVTVASGTIPFGYFDWVQGSNNKFVAMFNSPGTTTIYDSAGAVIASSSTSQIDVSSVDFPFDGTVRIYDASSRPVYNGYLRSLSGGDALAYKVMDFGRRASSLSVKPMDVRTDKFSLGGQDQSMFFNGRDGIALGVSDLTNDQAEQLREFWQDIQRGEYFSLAIDSDNRYFGTLAGWVYATASLTLGPSTNGLGKGAKIRVVTKTRSGQAVATVSSVTSGTVVALTAGLQVANGADGLVMSQYYWPVAKTADQALGLTLSNVKLKRWSLMMNLVEVIE